MLVSNQWGYHKLETAEKCEQQEINSMKKQLIGFLLSAMLLSMCVGCSAESTTTEPTETAEAMTTEESTSEQAEEAMEASEETKEQEPEAIEEPGEEVATETEKAEVTPETTTEPEATKEPEETADSEQVEIPASPATEPASPYTYTDMSATMYAQQTVNVRDLPDTKGNKLGGLSTNDEITVTGQCNETGWYRFEYDGSVAYVSDKYVGENKVEVQQATVDNGGQASAGASTGAKHWYDGYEMNIWYDMGLYMYKFVPKSEDLQYYVIAQEAQKVLAERYPERAAIMGGSNPTPVPEGTICVVVSSLQKSPSQFSGPEEGEIVWGEIPYIWK